MLNKWGVGDKIDNRWEIHKILFGGMSIVYIVFDHDLQEAFAAKTFQDELFLQNPTFAEYFRQESFNWINLDKHQNVTQARFVMDIQHKPFLFLEYITGGDLSSWMGTPRLTEDLPQVILFAIQFCDGMIHANSMGIVAHRDIKPQNCLIDENHTLKVADFGLAKALSSILKDEGRGGTPQYMPPEQWNDFAYCDVRSDIYSFGVMLFQMTTGHLPFICRTWQEFKRLHMNEPPPVSKVLNSELRNFIEICLDKNPAYRFPNFQAVRIRLVEIYEEIAHKRAPNPMKGVELNAIEWNNKGVSLLNLGRDKESLAYFDKSLELNPRLDIAYMNKGLVLFKLGRYDEAMSLMDRAVELNLPRANIWVNKGTILLELNRDEEALFCYEQAIKIDPLNWQSWCSKATVLLKLKYYDEAFTCIEQAIILDSRNGVIWSKKAQILYEHGQKDKAISCFDYAIKLSPYDEEVWNAKGALLDEMGHHEEGIKCLNFALKIKPNFPKAWSNKGIALKELGRFEEAIFCYNRALSINPNYPKALINKGNVLYELGRYIEALDCIDHGLKISPNDAESWSNKGGVLERLGRYGESIACYDCAIKINPNLAPTWSNKGLALKGLSRFQEGIECCNHAIKINPQLGAAWFNKGSILASMGRLNDATNCLEESAKLGFSEATKLIEFYKKETGESKLPRNVPDMEIKVEKDATFYDAMGVVAGKIGQHEEAIVNFDKAIELNPNLATAWHNKGSALNMLGRFDEAIICFERALKIKPDYDSAWLNKGAALGNEGRLSEALLHFEKAMKLGNLQAAQYITLTKNILVKKKSEK